MSTDSASPESYAPLAIVLTFTLLIFFFVGFFSIYFCRCSFIPNFLHTWGPGRGTIGARQDLAGPGHGHGLGLDPSIIKTFPTFTYSSVKDYRREKYGLECAICLCEFEDENMLRLLTTCCHVFHQECVDLWFESHNSCPFCRRSLDKPEKSPQTSPASANTPVHGTNQNNWPLQDTHSITIKEENEEREMGVSQVEGSHDKVEGFFSRSNSTGHSIIMISRREEEEEDRFKLILPEHVKAKIIRGHNLTRSCTTFGEYKSRTTTGNGGFGEVSGEDVNKV